MWQRIFFVSLSLALGDQAVAYAAPADPVELFTFKTHSRIFFRVDESVETVWKDVPGGFELTFKGLALADVGAPLGGEDEWARKIQDGARDSRLESIRFSETPGGLVVTGKWRFPDGEDGPADARMERFDYREKSPPRFVVDFWPKGGPSRAEVKAQRIRADRDAALKKSEDEAHKRAERRLASETARAEAEDITKFCRMPLSDQTDIFLSFLPIHDRVSMSRWFPTTTPDSSYIYLKPKADTRDAQFVRIALELYRKGKPALVLRTLEFFAKETPNSQYRHEMKFLRANALIRLGMEADAFTLLNDLTTTVPDSPVALHSGMYMAAKAMDRGHSLQAMEGFLWLINHYPEHRLNWVFHLGAAEALYALKQTDRAAKEYQWVVVNGPDRRAQAEASARMGDLYLTRLLYESALAGYFQTLDRFKDQMKAFPTVYINRAETLYWLGQYDRAEGAFLDFLRDFPAHTAGWRATYRLGEIFGRRAGKDAQAQSRKWFYETINRFPFTPGSTLARARLLPCGDHGGFAIEAAERFFKEEMAAFDGGGEVVMERYRDFRGLAHVRSLITLGREDLAVTIAITELQANARSEARHIVGGLLRTLFRKTVLAMLAGGKRYEALQFYRERVESIPKGRPGLNEPVDPDYLLKLSQAASDLGLGQMAENLSNEYVVAAGPQAEGRSPAAEATPASIVGLTRADLVEDLEGRLRRSEEGYTEAKALWINNGAKQDAHIRAGLAQVIEESEFSYEREVILGLLDDKAGKPASALQHAVRAEMLIPSGPRGKAAGPAPGERERVGYWLATLHAKAGDPRLAIEIFKRLEHGKAAETSGNGGPGARLGMPSIPDQTALIIAQGELLARLGRWGDAASAWARAVDNQLGGNHARYEYARALGRSGDGADRARSRDMLQALADSKTDDFWRTLAREALAGKVRVNNAKEGGT